MSVPEEFSSARDMKRSDWRDLFRSFFKFLLEESEEPEHSEDNQPALTTEPNAGMPLALISRIDEGKGAEKAEDGEPVPPAPESPSMAFDPLTAKGEKILSSMKEEYGAKKGEQVFYASKNAGKIKGVDGTWRDYRWAADRRPTRLALDRSLTEGMLSTGSNGLAYVCLAFDFASIGRSEEDGRDEDGRLHVRVANISKATVNPYWGWEIPDYENLGLSPDKIYRLLRDPRELEAAAPTFNNIQILLKHEPVSSDTEGSHLPELTIGSTGTDAHYEHPYLRNSLVLWDKRAIDDVEQRRKRELSCAYRYSVQMTPGKYEGQTYDGVMRDIIGNHVCLVREGRAGSDVAIGDEKISGSWHDRRFSVTCR